MAGGRPRKSSVVSFGKIGREKKLNRAIQEERLKLSRDDLMPPAWLDLTASREFYRVVEETEKIDLLDNLDLSVLAIYANSYSQYIESTKAIRSEGLTVLDGTKIIANPHVTIQDKCIKQIMICSSKLGLAITDRLKLIVPTTEAPQKNRYLEFVK